MEIKPSERIKEIHDSLKILDGQNPNDKNFSDLSFTEQAIINYLDEKEFGTKISQRSKIKNS